LGRSVAFGSMRTIGPSAGWGVVGVFAAAFLARRAFAMAGLLFAVAARLPLRLPAASSASSAISGETSSDVRVACCGLTSTTVGM